jgi:diguanylate cyclase (GGDEF)-like protein
MNILFIETSIQKKSLLATKTLLRCDSSHHVTFCHGLQDATLNYDLKDFDVIVVSVSLKDFDSREISEQIAYFTKRLPLIALADLDHDTQALRFFKFGVEDCLNKKTHQQADADRVIAYAIERFQIKRQLQFSNEEQKTLNLRLQQLAIMDPVTELLNLRGLKQIMMRELELLKRGESNLLFLVVGLDSFKRINNQLGHRSGDIILQEISQRLKKTLRPSDYVARIEGDEFLILLPQTRFAEGVKVAEKIRLSISQTPVLVSSGEGIYITASLGLGTVTDDFLISGQLLSQTHTLLYQSKAAGKNKISYEGCRYKESKDPLNTIYEKFQMGVPFRAVRQQIMNLNSKTCAGYEMLSRSNVESFEMPDDFFKISMESNSLGLVDVQCFTACIGVAKDLPSDLKYHINLFPSTLIDVPTHSLLKVIEESKSAPSKYCIEISEQQIIGEPSYLVDAVSQLKKAGLSIAIDDVGFGRSCLESLVLLEPEIVKIDKKWVTGIKHKSSNQRSLSRFLKVTQALGAEVIAEGVETCEDLEVLQDMGVLFAQGYYFGKPA